MGDKTLLIDKIFINFYIAWIIFTIFIKASKSWICGKSFNNRVLREITLFNNRLDQMYDTIRKAHLKHKERWFK